MIADLAKRILEGPPKPDYRNKKRLLAIIAMADQIQEEKKP